VTPNPFRSRDVRRAVSLALDRRRLVPKGASRPLPASQLVPAFIFGFDPSLHEPAFDLEAARALMAGAGLASGFEVTLHVREVVADTATQVQELLAPLGIRVNVAALPDPEYFALARGERPSLFLSRFGCSTGDASDLFDSALHTPDATRHVGSANAGGVSDAEVDRLIAESASTADVASRRTLLQRLMGHVLEEAYWLPLVLDEDVYLVRRGVAFSPRADGYLIAAEVGWDAAPGSSR
jgi:peptide/nickel transport system substrate-binding protein